MKSSTKDKLIILTIMILFFTIGLTIASLNLLAYEEPEPIPEIIPEPNQTEETKVTNIHEYFYTVVDVESLDEIKQILRDIEKAIKEGNDDIISTFYREDFEIDEIQDIDELFEMLEQEIFEVMATSAQVSDNHKKPNLIPVYGNPTVPVINVNNDSRSWCGNCDDIPKEDGKCRHWQSCGIHYKCEYCNIWRLRCQLQTHGQCWNCDNNGDCKDRECWSCKNGKNLNCIKCNKNYFSCICCQTCNTIHEPEISCDTSNIACQDCGNLFEFCNCTIVYQDWCYKCDKHKNYCECTDIENSESEKIDKIIELLEQQLQNDKKSLVIISIGIGMLIGATVGSSFIIRWNTGV